MSAVEPDKYKTAERSKVSSNASPVGVPRDRQTEMVVRDRLAKGMVMFVLAILVLIAGIVGYTQYDEYIEPNMPIFVCCVPSALLASALLFFGFARRWTLVRQVNLPPQQDLASGSTGDRIGKVATQTGKARKIRTREYVAGDGIGGGTRPRQTRPVSREQLEKKREHIRKFIDDLDEQYKEGLLMEDSYTALKNKNLRELRELELKERLLDEDAGKK